MSLKSKFLAFKKGVQLVQIGGRGEGNLDKIQNKAFFPQENVPNDDGGEDEDGDDADDDDAGTTTLFFGD